MARYPFPRQAPHLRVPSLLFAAALALTACGGGGGGGEAGGGGDGTNVSATPPAAVQPAVIGTQPAAQSVVAGQPVIFTVAATGDGLGYQWQRDAQDIPGATGASYTLAQAQLADDGASFTVVVKNAGGSVRSAAAALKVTPAAGPGVLGLLAGPLGGPGNLDGAAARFDHLSNIVASPSGTLYVNDAVPFMALRVITRMPGRAPIVTTLPREQNALVSAVDRDGNLYENDNKHIYKRTPDGVRTQVAGDAVFQFIMGMAVDASGTLYVADAMDYTIRKVTPQGVVTTLAGSSGQAGTQDGTGTAARFNSPGRMVIDKAGNLIVADSSVVRRITPDGKVTTLAGQPPTGMPPVANPALFDFIGGLGVDASGNVYVLDGHLWRVAPNGEVSNFTAPADPGDPLHSFDSLAGMAQDDAGNMYVVSGDDQQVLRVTLAGEVSRLAGQSPQFGSVDGKGAAARFTSSSTAYPASNLYVDAQGTVFVSDGTQVRKITPGGDVSTLALPGSAVYYTSGYADGGGLLAFGSGVLSRVDANGNSHFLAGKTLAAGEQAGQVDGVGANARFYRPSGFIPDGKGNVYCRDLEPPSGIFPLYDIYALRRISADGTVVTLPVDMSWIVSWFVDRDGRPVLATANGDVLRVEADNSLTTLRSQPVPPQNAKYPQTVVAGDRGGNLYIADYTWTEDKEGSVLHKITPAGVDTVIAGRPDTVGDLPDSAPSSLGIVKSLTVGNDGTVYIMTADSVLKLAQ